MTRDEQRWWYEAALDDLSAFRSLRDDRNYSLAAFHLQQSAQKLLKSLCLSHGMPVFTHSCVELLRRIESMGMAVPEDARQAARRLDPHYIMARYPNGLGGSPRDYYDAALVDELESCHRILMNFAESHRSGESGSIP